LNSEALEYELSRIPDDRRRNEVMAVLALADEHLEITDEAEALAESLESCGVDPIDAVHLALASTANADFFGTCDDRLLRKSQAISGLACKVVSVLCLVPEVVK
jgi:predicted nucleic acid-binding protein